MSQSFGGLGMTKSIWIGDRISRAGLLLLTALALASCAGMTGLASSNAALDQSSQSLVQLGDAARQSGDLAAAVQFYRNALTENPNQVDVLLVLGGTLFQGGDYGEAIESYNKVLTIAPQHADAHLGIGRVYLAQHKSNQAQVEFTAALRADPKNIQALNDLGVVFDMLGRHSDAQQSYTNGLELAPDDTALRNNLGLSLALGGDYDKAVVELSRLSLEPDSIPRIRQNLALALGLKGDAKGAERLLRADLDEQSVRDDLRYFAALRRLNRSSSVQKPPTVAAADSSASPVAAIVAAPPNQLPGKRAELAPPTKPLPRPVEVASVAAASQDPPGDEVTRIPVPAATSIYVAAGMYSTMDNAKRMAERLNSLGAKISTISKDGRPLYRCLGYTSPSPRDS